jgi:hypothetical protein
METDLSLEAIHNIGLQLILIRRDMDRQWSTIDCLSHAVQHCGCGVPDRRSPTTNRYNDLVRLLDNEYNRGIVHSNRQLVELLSFIGCPSDQSCIDKLIDAFTQPA